MCVKTHFPASAETAGAATVSRPGDSSCRLFGRRGTVGWSGGESTGPGEAFSAFHCGDVGLQAHLRPLPLMPPGQGVGGAGEDWPRQRGEVGSTVIVCSVPRRSFEFEDEIGGVESSRGPDECQGRSRMTVVQRG
ncbi:hypothetical protein CI238_06727 [Colletotrichum incanum]|uniref:Uncharacterized protein n=1 Tax=Colletotrichum incanum TaxID=1573173 RepID=A0A162N2Q7_COLIC|nr:hypothetical protein CI238_06727 [Colletotrichum incanum]